MKVKVIPIAVRALGTVPKGDKFTNSQEKINHLMYMDDIKKFAKNEKELETLVQTIRIYSQDIGMEFGIEKWASNKTE